MSRAKPEKEIRNILTAERQAEYEAWHTAVKEAGEAILPRLRSLPIPDLKALMLQADVYLESQPLCQTGARRFFMPLWGGDMTGAELIALVVLGFWLYYGESEHMVGGSIMSDWGDMLR